MSRNENNQTSHSIARSASSSNLNIQELDALDASIVTLFKSSALHVTQLYKESLDSNKKAYFIGYHRALGDTWEALSRFHHISQQSSRSSEEKALHLYHLMAQFLEDKRNHTVHQQESLNSTANPTHTASVPVASPLDTRSQRNSAVNLQPEQPSSEVVRSSSAVPSGSSISSKPSHVGSTDPMHGFYKHRSVKRRISDGDGDDHFSAFNESAFHSSSSTTPSSAQVHTNNN